MSLILRVDVDKPYGHSNLVRKIASKFTEDYAKIPLFHKIAYLSPLKSLLEFCNENQVKGYFYHRNCTVPNTQVTQLLKAGGHEIGFHAEDTRSLETFQKELQFFKDKVAPLKVNSFTKHGSGKLKLGKNHYPPFEPEKYKVWSKKIGVSFLFGNEICEKEEDMQPDNNFYKSMFWMEHDYRHPNFQTLDQVIELAKNNRVVVLIHPANYATFKEVRDDFQNLVKMSHEYKIDWEII